MSHFSILVFCSLIFLSDSSCQSSSVELEKAYLGFMSKSTIDHLVNCRLSDSRDHSILQYCVLTDLFSELSIKLVKSSQTDLNLEKIKPIIFNADVQYYNFTKSSTNLFFKSIIRWKIDQGDFLTKNISGEIVIDTLIGDKNLSKYIKSNNKSLLLDKMNDKIVSKLFEILAFHMKDNFIDIYHITTFGKCPLNDTNKDDLNYAEQAAMMGISEASSNLFGFTLTNETTVKDFGDLTDIITKKFSGELLGYDILKEFNYKTIDGYFCTLVSFIIKSKLKQ